MFREMRRFKQQITEEECVNILKAEPRGVLSVLGDDGYPYGVPMDFWYDPENGHLYFHSSKVGHKIDSMKKCDKVTFTVWDEGYRKEGEWALNIKSVIIFGRIRFVENMDQVWEIGRKLGYKYTDDAEYVEKTTADNVNRVQILELVPEHITGKLVNES